MDIRELGEAVSKVKGFFTYTPKVELLPDYEFLFDYPSELRHIARKRRGCSLNGHMFSLTHIVDGSNYTVECQRCFPHIDSRHVISSYNPFAMNDSKAAD